MATLLVLASGSGASASPPAAEDVIGFLGSATISTGTVFAGTEVGGLSGLAYDAKSGLFLAVSDDRSERAPARVYALAVDLARGRLAGDGVRIVGVTTLKDADGREFPPRTVDFEGMARLADGSLFISSEGDIGHGIPPFVGRFSAAGRELGRLSLPDVVLPREDRPWGVRDNLAFEAVTVTPDGRFLFVATENALAQDGPQADVTTGTLCRVLGFSLPEGAPAGQWVYPAAPVVTPPASPGGFRTNGLPDLLALDDEHCLALERAAADGNGYSVRLYLASFRGASDVSAVPALAGPGSPAVRPMSKRLLLDLATLGVRLQNLEGMALGPVLPDGRRALLVVSDNNFGARGETTLFVAFSLRLDKLGEVAPRQASVSAIQGGGHASPFAGEEVADVPGVVTAVTETGFWMQAAADDGIRSTSDGILVTGEEAPPALAPGDEVRVDGRVEDVARGRELPVTRLVASRVQLVGRGRPLPVPVVIGPGGLRPPEEVVEDDGFVVFDPAEDGADFFEALEGMRVAVRDPAVVGPTSERGEFVVLASSPPPQRRTGRGGIAIGSGRFNPQRLIVSTRLLPAPPEVTVGDRFSEPLVGVVDSAHGAYRVVLTAPPAAVVPGDRRPETTTLAGDARRVSVATFNVENLAFTSSRDKFDRIADIVVARLRSPDILAVQEIQDDSGPVDDGATSAARTLARLIQCIAAAGGPRYEARQIDPENNQDGGANGANIRVVLLANPARVAFVDRGAAGARDPVRVLSGKAGVWLDPSPGRLEPLHPAWQADRARGVEGSRKPLAVELRFGSRRLFVVNLHLRSKGGDAPLFGREQPPPEPSLARRTAQAEVVRDFVAAILARDADAAVVVLGDCNDFPWSRPLATLRAAPLVDVVERLAPADRYTYVYQGNSQVLDHILVSPALAGEARIDAVHVNADFPEAARASDHDPLIATLRLR